jgi:death-on-curing protein
MGNRRIRISPGIVEEVFRVVCEAAQAKSAIINQADIDLAIFEANREKNLADQAGVAMYRIASGHAFINGNKRTAILLAELILNKGGHKLKANPDATIKLLQRIASGKAKPSEVKRWVHKHAVKL